MEIIKPSIRPVRRINSYEILVELETAARKCYKSEGKLTAENAGNVVRQCIISGHDSVIEHVQLSFDVVLDNGILREWTRHRIASYSVESTRYCNYGKRGMKFVEPLEFTGEDCIGRMHVWKDTCEMVEGAYNSLLNMGAQLQDAREVLNFSVGCEMRFSANLRSLRNLLRLRCAKEAHLHMRQLCIPMLLYLRIMVPVVFDDIPYDESYVEKYYGGDTMKCIQDYVNPIPTLNDYTFIIKQLEYNAAVESGKAITQAVASLNSWATTIADKKKESDDK